MPYTRTRPTYGANPEQRSPDRPAGGQRSDQLSLSTGINGQPNYNISMNTSGFSDMANDAWRNAQGMGGIGSPGANNFAGGSVGANTQSVQQNQLMSHHLNSLLDADNDYMRRARQSGLDMAHQRGLGNSSIAAGNAMGAAIDRAAPIAGFDASRYGSVADQNMAARNQAALATAQMQHQAGMQNASFGHASSMQELAHQNAMQGMMFGHGLGASDDFRRHMLNMENREDTQAFQSGQADIDRFINQNQFYSNLGQRQFEFNQNDAFANRQLNAQVWQNMFGGFTNTINSIYNNPNLSAEQQSAAVSQVRQQFPGFANEAWQMLPPGVISNNAIQGAQMMPPMPPLRRTRP